MEEDVAGIDALEVDFRVVEWAITTQPLSLIQGRLKSDEELVDGLFKIYLTLFSRRSAYNTKAEGYSNLGTTAIELGIQRPCPQCQTSAFGP